MRASHRSSLTVPALAACVALGCGGTSADEGDGGILQAVRDYTAADATGDSERFCSTLTDEARASFAEASRSSSCVRTVEERHAFAADETEGVRDFRRFLERLADAAADPSNLRIERTGDTAQVRVKRRGEPSYPVALRLEDGRWKVDEAAETATLR